MEFNPNTLQANIIKSHGRDYTTLLCLKIPSGAQKAPYLAWLKKLGEDTITSYQQQLDDSEAFRNDQHNQEPVYSLFLSQSAYKKLEIREEFHPQDASFRRSMNSYDELNTLKIYDYQPPVDGILNQLDLILLIAHDDPSILEQLVDDFTSKTEFKQIFPEDHIQIESGAKPSLASAIGTSRLLGFKDDISTPTDPEHVAKATLVQEVQQQPHFGSYLVFRKTQVNDQVFKRLCYDIMVNYGLSEDYAEALIIGRFRNGTPLVNYPHAVDETLLRQNATDIHFDYQADPGGHICPYAAHIRAVNRRDGHDRLPIIRRSIIYHQEARPEKGLIFMSYQGNIVDQFRSIFEQLNRDLLLYPANIINFSISRGGSEIGPPVFMNRAHALTGYRGGDYFYCPSLHFLQNISN